MKSVRIGILLAAGVLWLLLAPQNVVVRYVSLATVMSVVYAFTVVLYGRGLAAVKRGRESHRTNP